MVYKSSSIAPSATSGGGGSGSIGSITSSGNTIAVSNPTGPITNIDVANNTINTLAGYNNSGIFSDVAIGSNLTLSGGVLSSNVVSGPAGGTNGSMQFNNNGSLGGTGFYSTGNSSLALIGELFLPASTTGAAPINLSIGASPIAPILGDIWSTSSGLFFRNFSFSTPTTRQVADLNSIQTFTNKTLLTGAIAQSVVIQTTDANFFIENSSDITKSAKFDATNISSGTNQIFAFPNKSGQLALTNDTVTVNGVGGIAGGGSVPVNSSSFITLGMATSIANTLAGYNNSGVFSDISIGSNLTLVGGVLAATGGGGGTVSSVFGRTGAVIAQSGDYGFGLISGIAAVSQGGTGATSFTAHSILLGEGIGAVSVATTGTSGRLLIDQGNADPSFQVVSGDVTITNTGATSIKSSVSLVGNPTATTQAAGDNSTRIATDAFVTTAINNAIAGVNPAVSVLVATTQASDTSGLTYNNGVSGVGATLTGSNNTALTFDGVTLTTVNQRVLVKNDTQSPSGAFNGVYYLTQIQTAILPPILTRALDYNQPADINSTGAIPVVSGTVNADTSWLLTSNVTTVGTDALTYVQFTLNPSTIITTSTSAGGSLTGTYPNPVVASGAVSNSMLVNSSLIVKGVSGVTGGGSVALGSSITLGMAGNTANTLAGYNSSGAFSDVSIGSNLSLSGGILNGTVGPAAVTSVFGRTGAVVAVTGDYSFGLVSGTAAVSQGGTGAGSFTAHSVLLGEGTSAISAATTGTSGRLLIDQGASDPAFKIVSGGATINNSGILTLANPSTSSLGGIQSISAITHNFIIGISNSGIPALSQPAFTDLSGTITTAQLPSNQTFREITFSLDGQALPISAISGFNTWYLSYIPYAGTITGWNIVADVVGSINIDIWKKNASVPTISNTITASAQCSLLSSQSIFNGPITGWTSAISKGDVFAFNLISAASITKANLTIQVSVL